MKEYELKPLPNTQKSFYGKAKIIENENIIELKSYETIVAQYDKITKEIKIFDRYSKTTTRHIKAFLEYIKN